MRLKHITDDEIQDYLDGNISSEMKSIEGHLEVCDACQANLERYRLLYGELKNEEDIRLSPYFSEAVMSRLPASSAKKTRYNYLNILMIVLGIVLSIAVTVQYFDVESLLSALPGKSSFNIEIAPFDFSEAKDMVSRLGSGLNLLLFAAAVIILVAVIDRLVLKPYAKHFRSKMNILLI